MIVVSNTSPLTNLAAVGQFELLRLLYQEIYIADAVWSELHAQGQQWPGAQEVTQAQWVKRAQANNHSLVVALQRDLDRGEAETIALALEQKADLVLLDERAGRRAATRLGLRVTGIIGLLLEAKVQGHLVEVQPLLYRLRMEAGFFLSDNLYRLALELAQESNSQFD